jgi:hypothetical protein
MLKDVPVGLQLVTRRSKGKQHLDMKNLLCFAKMIEHCLELSDKSRPAFSVALHKRYLLQERNLNRCFILKI